MLPPIEAEHYADAQLSTYRTRADFAHRPPMKLRLKARFSGHLPGTAGFGFWNHPFGPGMRGLRLPSAIWFFYGAPPNNMALAMGVPGWGWKAAQINADNWQFLALLPTAPIAILLMRSVMLYRRLWSVAQHALRVSEKPLSTAPDEDWHDYSIDWKTDGTRYYVDEVLVHESMYSPRGPLGFVAWVDNQYAVVTPQGRLAFGVTPSRGTGLLELKQIRIAEY
jgi:hypothetical protein